jgi:hypothetical protein
MAGHECMFYQHSKTEEGGEMETCIQEEHIAEIKDMLKEISRAVIQVAAQNERLDGMEEKNKEQDKSLNILYERVRVIDMILGKDGDSLKLKIHKELMDGLGPLIRLLEILNSKVFLSVVAIMGGMVIVGALCDLAYHNDLVKMLWKLVPVAK